VEIKDNANQTLHPDIDEQASMTQESVLSNPQDVADDVNSLLDLMSQAYDKIVSLHKRRNRISVEQAKALYSGADKLHNSIIKLTGGIIRENIPKETPAAILSGW